MNERASWDLILQYVQPLEKLLLAPDISEVMVNPGPRVFIERNGAVEEVQGIEINDRMLQVAVKNIARRLGDDISEEVPLLDSRLADGSRVAAVFPPCSLGGVTLTVRKFNARNFTIDDLIARQTLTPAVAEQLRAAVLGRRNILISGGTGSGKTTLLNILSNFIPDDDRIVVIEDTAEIHIRKPNLVRLEARRGGPETPAVTIRQLLKATLRHRPDRVVVGEIRDGAAYDLLQALNTGHAGSMSTLHADSARHALDRFASLVLESDVQLPFVAIKHNIGSAVQLLVHIERRHGTRYVQEILELQHYDPSTDRYELVPLYQRKEMVHA